MISAYGLLTWVLKNVVDDSSHWDPSCLFSREGKPIRFRHPEGLGPDAYSVVGGLYYHNDFNLSTAYSKAIKSLRKTRPLWASLEELTLVETEMDPRMDFNEAARWVERARKSL